MLSSTARSCCTGQALDGIKHRCMRLAAESSDYSIPRDASGKRLEPCPCKLTSADLSYSQLGYSPISVNVAKVKLTTDAIEALGKAAAQAMMPPASQNNAPVPGAPHLAPAIRPLIPGKRKFRFEE